MSPRTVLHTHLPALIWSLVVLVLLVTPGDEIPELGAWKWLDKPAHALLFAVHCGLLASSLASSRMRDRGLSLAAVVSGLYAVLLEAAQIRVPGRSWEWWDLVADLVGIAVAALFIAGRRARLRGAS